MTEATHEIFSVEDVREHHVRIMQLINLPSLAPFLKQHNVLPPEDLAKVSDGQHYTTIERTGFLLHSLYSKDQATINTFIQCLREEKDHQGHQEILSLLDKGTPDLPDRSPLFEILELRMNTIVDMINITTFLNALTNSGAIKVSSFLDLANPDRRVKENMERLFRILEEKGVTGFISFLSCLRSDPTPSHEKLFTILFRDVQSFFKEHPRREEVLGSDKIEILQLETRGKVLEQEVLQRFEDNRSQLEAGINIPILLPYLIKHNVISEEDAEEFSEDVRGEDPERLLSFIASRPPFWVVKFSECLKESKEHSALSELLLPSPSSVVSKDDFEDGVIHKNDKVVVMIHMAKYAEVDEHYQRQDYVVDDFISNRDPERVLRQDREDLLNHFSQLNFKIIHFNLDINLGAKDETEDQEKNIQNREIKLAERFKNDVIAQCSEEAVIFIYISGIQFPYQHPNSPGEFSGAILLEEASNISRKETDCLKARDMIKWVELLPKAYFTFLIDCEQSFVAKFGKQRLPELIDILEDPWASLTDLHSPSVVYYLQPDSQAISRLRKDEEVELATGMLTECFNFALLHCFLRNSEGQEINLCHRRFYEAISFYWHRKGRQHRAFVPAVRGDHSREFLGRGVFPYHQVFRVDLVKSATPDKIFDIDKLSIRVGTMAKMILGDEMELFHLLRPNVRVRGKISQSQPLNCSVEIERDEERDKMIRVLKDIYQNQQLFSKDGSTEFLFAVKVLHLHERVSVATEGLGETESIFIKSYIEKKSPQLLFVTRGANSKVIVHKSGGGNYFIEDKEKDVKHIVKVKRLSLILTFLEMIAWFKYVKKLRSMPGPSHQQYNCFLNAEKPLLQTASPLCDRFTMKWSSFDGVALGSSGHEVILQPVSKEPAKFWTPSPPIRDPNPCLGVEFKGNYVITALELRGDPDANAEVYLRHADIYHQRNLFNDKIEGPSTEHLTRDVPFVHDEAVQFVTIKPLVMAKEDFSITFRMICKKKTREVEALTVVNWAFHEDVGTGWKFTPSPNPEGIIFLDAGYHWISWRGKSLDRLTFDLGLSGNKLEKIEFTSLTESNFLSQFELSLQTSWKKEVLPEMKSFWPPKYEFPRPLIISSIQLWPAVAELPNPDYNTIKLQLQLYGNKHNSPIDVEEGDILSFHFNNFTQQPHFVCMLCLEETGLVKHVMMDIADPISHMIEEGKTIPCFPSMKKLIQTDIPEGYVPDHAQIRDFYKIFLCQHRMYLDPFVQQSLHQHHYPCSYTVCSFVPGRKDVRKGNWYDYTFEVVVKMSTIRK